LRKQSILEKIKRELKKDSARLLFLTVSGSDLYGFSSKDSDIDLRGIFSYSTSELLGLGRKEEVKKYLFGNFDIVLYELRKAITLTLAGNCTFLETLHSTPIYVSRDFKKLRTSLLKVRNKRGLVLSYRGMGIHNYNKYLSKVSRKAPVKKFLYVFRGLLSAKNILEDGEIEPNINKLLEKYSLPQVKSLVQMKTSERAELKNRLKISELKELYEKLLRELEERLDREEFRPVPKELEERIEQELISFRVRNLLRERKAYKTLP